MNRLFLISLMVSASPQLPAQTMVIISGERPDQNLESGFVKRSGLDGQDVQSIPEFVPGIKAIYPTMSQFLFATVTDRQTLESVEQVVQLAGIGPEHRLWRQLKIVNGSHLQPKDFELATSRCLISATVATELFRGQMAVGRYVMLRGLQPMLITGTFEHTGRPVTLITNPDILIPIRTFQQRIPTLSIHRAAGSFSAEQSVYSELQIHIAEGAGTTNVIRGTREYLSRRYPVREFQFSPLRLSDVGP